jgi:hypothetical protein
VGQLEVESGHKVLEVVHIPTIHGFESIDTAIVVDWLAHFGFCIFGPQLFIKSQLVVVIYKLCWLQETPNLGLAFTFSCLGISFLLLLLLSIQLSVVACKLLQLDKEIT